MSYIIPLFVSALSCLIVIRLITPFAINIKLVDIPSNRKRHNGNIPLVGGIGIFIALTISLLTTQIDLIQQKNLLIAMLLIVSVGALDDHKDLSVRSRFFLNIVAILVVVGVDGIVLHSLGLIFGFFELELHAWATFFTVFAVIGVMNAINMSDGIDGLSGLLSLVTLLFIAYFSYIGKQTDYLMIALLTCSALSVFLLFNLGVFGESRKVFMGDAGTTFIGFLVAVLLIDLSQGGAAVFYPVTAIWLLSIPLMDALSSMLRRVINGSSLFKPDRMHLHHFLIRSGVGSGKVLVIIVMSSFIMAFLGSWMQVNGVAEWKMFVLFMLIFFLYLLGVMHTRKVMKFIKRRLV